MANNVAAGRSGFIGDPHFVVRGVRPASQSEFWSAGKALRITATLVNLALGPRGPLETRGQTAKQQQARDNSSSLDRSGRELEKILAPEHFLYRAHQRKVTAGKIMYVAFKIEFCREESDFF